MAYLELAVGADAMQNFLREYFNNYANQSITVDDMHLFFNNSVSTYFGATDFINHTLASLDWDGWVYGKGMPPVTIDFYNNDILDAELLCKSFIYFNGTESPPNFEKFFSFYSMQQAIFA